MPISEYITQIRMKEAKELLTSKKVKITEIGYMVGYSYPGYFSKVFKKYYGINPSEYELLSSN